MQTVLSTDRLTKKFGVLIAVDQLTISVRKGDVYGILGPNGSGKTTSLGMILGALPPSSGTFSWFEKGSGHALRKQIGALLEKPSFYPHLNALQNLRLVADIKNLNNPEFDKVLQMTGVAQYATRKFYTYSTGMKQRLSLAATLLGAPDVLVLDEPTNGLDPEGIADVRNLIIEIAKQNITVIMASHLLDEVQKVCSHVCVLKGGQKLYEGQVHTLISGHDGIEVGSDDLQKLETALAAFEGTESFEKSGNHYLVRLRGGFTSGSLSGFLITRGVDITHFAHRKGNLEEEFLHLLSGNVH